MGYNYQSHRYFLPSQDPGFSSHLIKANLSKLPITSKRLSPTNYVFLIMLFQLWFSIQPMSDNSHPHGAPKPRSSMALRPHTKALTPGILLSHVRYHLVQHTELLVIGHTHNQASGGLLHFREGQLAQILSSLLQTHTPQSFTLAVAKVGHPGFTPACSLHHVFVTTWSWVPSLMPPCTPFLKPTVTPPCSSLIGSCLTLGTLRSRAW